jgi:hypothetical protein
VNINFERNKLLNTIFFCSFANQKDCGTNHVPTGTKLNPMGNFFEKFFTFGKKISKLEKVKKRDHQKMMTFLEYYKYIKNC